ncbi:MAG: metallophosphoesterase [Candidatus Hydrogenedentes bacterium]|nr:metallophosphoesterase [Candidatus Hydrogenedentota bacterium]
METKQEVRRHFLRKTVRLFAALLVAGAIIFVPTALSENLSAPAWAEPIIRGLSRIAYMLRMPVMMVAASIAPFEGAHVKSPNLYYAWTSLAAPIFWAAMSLPLIRIGRNVRRRHEKRRLAKGKPAMSRRTFLAGAATCVAGAGGLGGYGVLVEPQRVRLARYTVAVRDLPASMDGFRIVHISDTHYGPFISLPFIRAVIDQANSLDGDLVILTGDYVHRTPLAIGAGVDVLKFVRARLGVVATLGNHDHWEGADGVRAAFDEIKLLLIDNARRFVTRDGIHDEPVIGESICIGGVGDLWEDANDFTRALADAPDGMPRIVLAHNPDSAEHVAPGTRIDLMCSGHTHGGQVWVPGFGTPVTPSAYGQKYAGGMCRGPHCPVLVSRGVGMAIMPVRFGVPPEIGEITLAKPA